VFFFVSSVNLNTDKMTQAALELCVPWFFQLFIFFHGCRKVKKFRPLSYAWRFSLYSPFPGGELLGRRIP